VLSCLVLSTAPAAAETTPAPPDPSSKPRPTWSGKFDLGATGFAGNNESLALSTGLELGMTSPKWEWDFSGDASLVDEDREDDERDEKRGEDYEIDTSLRRALHGDSYLSVKGSGDREPLSGVDSETQLGAGFGYHVRRHDDLGIRIEGGWSWNEEERTGDDERSYPGWYANTTIHRTFKSGADLRWTNDLKWGSDEGSNFTSDQELTLDSPITKRLSVSLLLDWEYDSRPSEDAEKDDWKLIAKLAWKLWAHEKE
jgi:putative salt-induced outer membrane protein YdiY